MMRLSRQLCQSVRVSLAGGSAPPPEAGLPLWNAFQGLTATRTYHAAGPNPIQPSEILAWCQLHRLPLGPQHVEILLAMDQAWLDHAYAAVKAPQGVKVLPPISKTPLTAGLLDALLG